MAESARPEPEDELTRERGLVRLCLAGDGAAQRELVRRYTPLVWSVCSRAGLAAAEAEDVTQEVFWSAFLALRRFRGESRLSTWFYTLALRRMADYRRAPARRDVPAGIPSSPEFPEPRQAQPASPEDQAVEAQRRERVRAALDDLAEPAHSVLLAYYLGEMAVAEIARTLRIPEGTVKTHLHRGRRLLRERLRDLC
jgi:RNA polymerase sigma-70 factor, ECF subfamily